MGLAHFLRQILPFRVYAPRPLISGCTASVFGQVLCRTIWYFCGSPGTDCLPQLIRSLVARNLFRKDIFIAVFAFNPHARFFSKITTLFTICEQLTDCLGPAFR